MITQLLFYMFAGTLILSSAVVISVRNPVHAILFLILAFFNAAALFLMTGAELLAMLLVIVYVGAVAVLFLFVVMMLDINFRSLHQGAARYGLIGGLVGLVLVGELIFVGLAWSVLPETAANVSHPIGNAKEISNAHSLGQLIYTHYFYIFQVSGLVLLVGMIGAIVLTLNRTKTVRRQDINKQNNRMVEDTLVLCKVESRKGVRPI